MSSYPLNARSGNPARPLADSVPTEAAGAASRNWGTITRGIRDGNEECFRILYDRFFHCIFRQVRSLTGRDESTCLDIVQEVLLKLIRVLKPIEDEARLVAWIRVVTRTTTYDWLRKELRKTPLPAGSADPEQIADGRPAGLSRTLLDAARLAWLEQQLRSLPRDTRHMISLRYRLGWSLKQIGTRFGLKTGAVDGRIRRAIQHLREQADRQSRYPDKEMFDD